MNFVKMCPARDIPKRQLENMIHAYRQDDVSDSLYDEGVKMICHCATFQTFSPKQGVNILRRRRFLNNEELIAEGCWYPKENPEISQGRFNEKGRAMAYFCDTGRTADMEVFGSDQNDHHSLVAVIKKKGLRMAGIFPIGSPMRFSENVYFNSTDKRLKERQQILGEEFHENMIMATEFIGEEVCRVRGDANYRLTNAIARVAPSLWRIDGFIYASTMTELSRNNFVIKPSAADEYVSPSELYGVQYFGPGKVPCITDMGIYKQ